ncbi:[protein-PII] uridylyltransferase [Candidatus Poribacteria bacterium]|nr:[protein-PII] uridylyltransferase [Candidatus Poribacteria bacterium]
MANLTKPKLLDNVTLPDLPGMLAAARERLRANHHVRSGREVARQYSEDMDALIRALCEALAAGCTAEERIESQLAVAATGGFGRRELNLFSDIDLLFLFRNEPAPEGEEFVKAFLHSMWNLPKVDLGYSVKTTAQALPEIGEDLDFTTTVLGAVRIWGSAEIWEEFQAGVLAAIRGKSAPWLIGTLVEGLRQRHARFSNTVLLLEPNAKESPGGLRDIHFIHWLAGVQFGEANFTALASHGMLNAKEDRALRHAHSFLLEVRNAMHLLEGRKTDVLNVERQLKLAPQLEFSAEDHALPEEQFMRTYYNHVGTVDRLRRRMVKRLTGDAASEKGPRLRRRRLEGEFWTRDGVVWVDPREVSGITHDTGWLLHLFVLTAQMGLTIDDFTMTLIEHHLAGIDEAYRRDPVNRERFLTILRQPRHAGTALRQMHDSRFLEAYIPEFGLVRNLPRIDYYHQFTVDEHLLRAVQCAADFFDPDRPWCRTHAGRVAHEILRWDLFLFALLFHDVGKGVGRGHVLRGAHLIARVADRIELPHREREFVQSLVANHHRLSFMALRRNPDDPTVPEELARDIAEPELLKMLYVLTCCDLRSVSHESWNDWRASLLANFYERTMDVLLGRTGKVHRAEVPGFVVTDKVMSAIEEDGPGALAQDEAISREDVDEFLDILPPRYRQSTDPADVLRHLKLSRRLDDNEVLMWELQFTEESNYAVLHCVARDSQGLFQHLCGALASRGFNILSAQIYTAKTGLCVDIFQIQDAERRPPKDMPNLERLRGRLNLVLRGDRGANWSHPIGRSAQVVSAARLDFRPPSVTISNSAGTENSTVLEIKSPDRPGLLYDIASVLDRHQINIHIAFIATESYQIADVFYVTDWENNRLEPGAATERLRGDLLQVITPPAEAAPGASPS